MEKLHNILISLIKSGICNTPLECVKKDELNDEVLSELVALSSKNDVMQIISDVLIRENLVSDEEMKDIFKLSAKNAFLRTQKILFEFNTLTKALEQEKIPFMPLKGSIIRSFYPKDWYRTSCDIDILIKKEYVKKAKAFVINNLGYTFEKEASHDISFFTPGGFHIELHFSLIEESSLHLGEKRKWNAKPLDNVWESANIKDGWEYFYQMSDELFYLYHIAHMAKHFESGGCGLRTVIDLWLIENNFQNTPQRENVLKLCGLDRFAKTISDLSCVWFSCEKHTEETLFLQTYIITGGVYGNVENNITYKQNKKDGKTGYIFYRIFMPYDALKFIYPTLQKHKWLYPFFTVRRWIERLLFGGRVKKSINELKHISQNTSSDELTSKIFDKLGL